MTQPSFSSTEWVQIVNNKLSMDSALSINVQNLITAIPKQNSFYCISPPIQKLKLKDNSQLEWHSISLFTAVFKKQQ